MMDDSVLSKVVVHNAALEDMMAAPTQARPYTQGIGVAIPPEMAAPAGAQLTKPEPPGFPLPGARPVTERIVRTPMGTRDDRVASWSAPVPDIAADLDERVARASTPSPAQSTRQPSSQAPAPFGSARIPNGGGRAAR